MAVVETHPSLPVAARYFAELARTRLPAATNACTTAT